MNVKKLLAIFLAASMILVGCSSNNEETTSSDSKENTSGFNSKYINLTMVKPTTINPVLNTDKSVGYVMNLIYDGLFTIDQDYNVVPQLAKEYSLSADGKSMNIKLKDAKWHSGNDVTSSDVMYTIGLIQKNTTSPYNAFTENIDSVNITNSKEFTINFKESYAFSKDTLIFPIVYKDSLSNKSDSEILENDNNLIGNGPYKIEKMEDREGMTLVVNQDYYDELSDTMKDIHVSIVPTEEEQVSMVMALESDMANISLGDLSQFYEDEFNITNYEGRDYESIIFNYDNKYLNDNNFRKAIAYAIDRNLILEEGYIDNAKLVNFPLNTMSKYYDSELKALAYNKTKAEEYLKKINPNISEKTTEKDSNNVEQATTENNTSENKIEKTNLTSQELKSLLSDINLKIIVNKDNEERTKAASIVSDNLSDIGIKTTIEALTSEEMTTALNNKDYDLAFIGWELSSIPDARSIIEASGYSDEKLTAYMESLAIATSDSKISEIYSAIQKHIRDKVAFISLVIRNEYLVTNERLEGKTQPNDFDAYEGIANLTIKGK
ncbi:MULTISPECIES: ABC transporter substrate-binding protein [unclassified Romboutsia]|uniref:ABC transporter substrate-binding protein n=1 Tax=unclassified Romboutsia TaxID=2626894 RepID=UPI000F07006D|nr:MULTISPECIES: ABC transporter substrate-binding protein [unclassified Romboutsia]